MTVTELHPEPTTTSYAEETARVDAMRAKTESDRRRQELADRKAEAKAQKDIEQSLAEAADAAREREQARRDEDARRARAEHSAMIWRRSALTIAIVCIVVSLPLQIMAFWDPSAWFLVAAPLVLEGVAWALLMGAQAAIDDDRPSWHYRAGALLQALIAAGINFSHGLEHYGPATAIGGALCSVIGPVIWDLHEHGRIAKREGRPSRAVRKAEKKKAAAERRRIAAANAVKAKADQRVWERAVELAAYLDGETVPSNDIYSRAWMEIHGAPVGMTAERIAHTRTAKRGVRVAQNGPVADENPQVDSQMKPDGDKPSKAPKKPGTDGRKSNGGTPPVRTPGTKYSTGARRQMSLEKKRSTESV